MKDHVKQPSLLNGWSVINGELCEVSLQKVFYELSCGEPELEMKKLIVMHQGESHVVESSNYYASEEDYRNGNSMNTSIAHLDIADRANAKNDGFEFWTMEDGIPTKKFHCVTSAWRTVGNNQSTLYDGIPDISKIYKTREDCLAWNEYVISYEDGKKETRKGAGLLLQLTDEQKKAVENVARALKDAEKLGVCIKTLYGDAYAFNTNELADFEIDYEPCDDNLDEKINFFQKEFRCPFEIYDVCEDWSLFFSRKK